MKPSRFGALAACICLSSVPVFAQRQQNLKPSESALVNQPTNPPKLHALSDYVPCTFALEDRANYHALFGKGQNSALAIAEAGIALSNLTPEQATWAENQIASMLKQVTATVSNISLVAETQLEYPSGPDANSANKLSSDQIKEVGQKIQLLASNQSIPAPNDIGCSESVLTFDETKDIFGRRMARIYIAVQVTIRNLNPDNEFLLHDIQVAVDTDLFFATRDKKLARGVAEVGQMMDPRNQAMRYLDTASSGLGLAAVPLGNIDFSNAVHGFSSFVPVLKGLYPDYTIAQLGRLDDLGFTSGSLTYVIPKSGSHSMVAFIPEKVFRNQCLQQGQSLPGGQPTRCDTKASKEKYKSFKKYTTEDFRAFQNSLEVLIAGVHVKEVSTAAPELTSFTCDAPKGDSVTCHLTGKNLQAATGAKIVFKSDSTEGSAKSIKYDVNKTDTTKADATFNAQDFATLKNGQAYTIVLINADGTDVNTTVTFTPGPDATSFTCNKPSAGSVSCGVVGKNLKLATALKLVPTTGNSVSSTDFKPDSTDDTKATATFSATDFASLKAGEKYDVVLVSNGKDIRTSAQFLPSGATVEKPDAQSLTCTAPKANDSSVSCQLVGQNLQLVNQIKLVPKTGKTVTSTGFDESGSTKATVTFAKTDFFSLTKGQPYGITLVPKSGSDLDTSATYTP